MQPLSAGHRGVRCYARTWINAGSGRAAECQLQRSGLWRDCPPESGESPGHMAGERGRERGEGAAGDLLFCSAGAWVATSALQLHALRRAPPAVKWMGAAGCAEAADAQPEKGMGHAAEVGFWDCPPAAPLERICGSVRRIVVPVHPWCRRADEKLCKI